MNLPLTEPQKYLPWFLAILLGGSFYLLSPILMPFLIGIFLAYIADPIADRLEAMKLSRTLSVIIVFLFMLLFTLSSLLIILPLIGDQVSGLLSRLPALLNELQTEFIPWVSQTLGIPMEGFKLDHIEQSLAGNWNEVGDVAGRFLLQLSSSGQQILLLLSYLLLIPVVTFYLLRDWDIILEKIKALIPLSYKPVTIKLAKECDAVLSEFLRGQLLVMLAQSIIYTIGLWLVGLEFALLIGIVAGLISFVPYLGVIVGITLASTLAFIQFQDMLPIAYVLLVFGIGQTLEGIVLSPMLVGKRIGLHPVAVIFAVMAGAQLLGLFGMLIALPVAAVTVALLRHFYDQYQTDTADTP